MAETTRRDSRGRLLRGVVCLGTGLALSVPAFASEGETGLEPRHAHSYACHQARSGVIVAAEPYERGPKVQAAFGKANPSEHGFLPLLLVISNDTDAILRLDRLRVQFVDARRQATDPTPAEEVVRYRPSGPALPDEDPYPPNVSWRWPRLSGRRSPLNYWQITAREFRAAFVAPKASASGFFYFWTGLKRDPIPGAAVYVMGLKDSRSGKDLMYYEIDLDPYYREREQENAGGPLDAGQDH